jgi:DNA repair ATPase RecN
MSSQGYCYVCGRALDNEEGTGYCSACAADVGIYAQRARLAEDGVGNPAAALAELLSQVKDVSSRLERLEERLCAVERRLSLLENLSRERDEG